MRPARSIGPESDEYGVTAGHKPVVIGTSFQDRAAIGMVGHGAAYHPGNKSHIVILFDRPRKPAWKAEFPGDEQEHRLMTALAPGHHESDAEGHGPQHIGVERRAPIVEADGHRARHMQGLDEQKERETYRSDEDEPASPRHPPGRGTTRSRSDVPVAGQR